MSAKRTEMAREGYANVLHGGVVSTLLDGAMTNCLFALAEGRLASDQILGGPGDDKHHEDATGGGDDSESHSCSREAL